MHVDSLTTQIQTIEEKYHATIGLSAYRVGADQFIEYNEEKLFLLCSTYKIPMAIKLLQRVESGELSLVDNTIIHDDDLRPGVASTLNQLDYAVPVQMSLLNLLRFMMQESCNTATDIILNLISGPTAVTNMLRSVGISDLKVDRSTLEALADWDGIGHLLPINRKITLSEYRNLEDSITETERHVAQAKFKSDERDHGTPHSMTLLLKKLISNELIHKTQVELLLSIMRRCKRGVNRIMGLLPKGIKVAHKTGTLTGYASDVGVLDFSDDRLILSIFVEGQLALVDSENIIAQVAKLIVDESF